jgi:hypothetical protein
MYGSRVIGIRLDTTGTGIKAIGLGHRMLALVGGDLAMSTGNILKAIGKEITGAYRMTTTGTVTGAGIFVRRSGVRSTRKRKSAVGATIANRGDQQAIED